MLVNLRNLPPDLQSIAEMVSDDYHTGYVGKWHLGDVVLSFWYKREQQKVGLVELW